MSAPLSSPYSRRAGQAPPANITLYRVARLLLQISTEWPGSSGKYYSLRAGQAHPENNAPYDLARLLLEKITLYRLAKTPPANIPLYRTARLLLQIYTNWSGSFCKYYSLRAGKALPRKEYILQAGHNSSCKYISLQGGQALPANIYGLARLILQILLSMDWPGSS